MYAMYVQTYINKAYRILNAMQRDNDMQYFCLLKHNHFYLLNHLITFNTNVLEQKICLGVLFKTFLWPIYNI